MNLIKMTMKNKIIMGAFLTLVLASCSGTKKNTTNNNTVQTEEASDRNSMQMTNDATDSNREETTSSTEPSPNMAINTNGSTGAMNNVMARNNTTNTTTDENKMFKALNMTEEQINNFNSAMERFKKRQANMASGEMLGSIESERNRQMESILSKEQFSRYQQWNSDNN